MTLTILKCQYGEDKTIANPATAVCTGKVVRVCAMKIYVWSRGRDPLILNLGTR